LPEHGVKYNYAQEKTMKKLLVLTLVAVVAGCYLLLNATAQRSDNLRIDGKEYAIFTNPLEPYLRENPDKLPKSEVVSTNLWRGYVATWEVKNQALLLADVEILQSVSKPGESGFLTELKSVIGQMFPGEKEVMARWFSGNIIVPDGKLVQYVHMGYASTYEKYILLRVEKGAVTRQRKTDVEGFIKFRDAQFKAYKKTEEYRKALAETSKEGGMSQKENEEFLRQYYSERYMSMIFDNQR
jgi:hypothetical protein